MLGRKLSLVLLLLAGALVAAPAEAEAQMAGRPVFRCEYRRTDNGAPMYMSPTFTVADFGLANQLGDAWLAWLKANRGVTGSRYDADCKAGHESNLSSVVELLARQRGNRQEQVDWIPPYGVPYALPRQIYYFCISNEQGLRRLFVTDLFTASMPENLSALLARADSAHSAWLRSQGIDYYTVNKRCTTVSPEPFQVYAAMLDGLSKPRDPTREALTRSAFPGIDKVAAPNLIDDLAARAKYAAMRIMGPTAVAKAAPPAPKPAPKPTAAPALTVKADTSIKDAAKAWDEQVKTALAAEAQKKVETAARTAQADAKRQAEIAAFFAERRKQGRAQ